MQPVPAVAPPAPPDPPTEASAAGPAVAGAGEPGRFGSGGSVLLARDADVGQGRERARQRRIGRVALVLAVPLSLLWLPILTGSPTALVGLPGALASVDPFLLVVGVFFLVLLAVVLGSQVVAGRSAAPDLPARAGQRLLRRRAGRRAGEGGRRPLAEPLPGPQDLRGGDGRGAAPGPAVRGAPRDRQDADGEGDGQGGRRPVPVRLGHELPVDVLRRDGPQDPLLLQGATQGGARGGRGDRLHRGDRRDRRPTLGHGDEPGPGGAVGHRPRLRRDAAAAGPLRRHRAGAGRRAGDVRLHLRGHRRGRQRAAGADAELRRADRWPEGLEQAGRRHQPAAARLAADRQEACRRGRTCWSSRRRTGPTAWTRRCCGPAASTAGSPSTPRPRRAAARSWTTCWRRSPTTRSWTTTRPATSSRP